MLKLTRRDFIKASSMGLGTAILSTGLTGCLLSDDDLVVSFDHGVASGDPLSDRAIIWTKLSVENDANATVLWQVYEAATDQMVVSDIAVVTKATDHTIKVDVAGLEAGTEYYFRFLSNGTSSVQGNFKTLPVGHVETAKFAVVSCSNYPAGYFNVYREIAQRNDIDAVLHLGDYIYEYGEGGYATENAEAIGRIFPTDNNQEILTLGDYRKRYALYRSDLDLQSCHQNHAFISVWDDHEVANDAYVSGAENHNEDEGDFKARKLAALQAYFEWMPIRDRFEEGNASIYRTFNFGDLLDLHMLDTRIEARDQAIAIEQFIDGNGSIDAQGFQIALADSSRTLLGSEQLQWLQGQIASSAAKWQVLGQQVLMGRMMLPAAIATRALSISEFALIAQVAQIAQIYQRYQAGDPTLTEAELALLTPENLALLEQNQHLLTEENLALIQLPAIPYNLDAWDGYAYEREVLLNTASALGANLVVLAGDTHNAWANDLRTLEGSNAGVEFATSSVSSPGLEQYLEIADRQTSLQFEAGVTQLIEELKYCNFFDRGYMTVTFDHNEATADWYFIDNILSNSYQVLAERNAQLKVTAGSNQLS